MGNSAIMQSNPLFQKKIIKNDIPPISQIQEIVFSWKHEFIQKNQYIFRKMQQQRVKLSNGLRIQKVQVKKLASFMNHRTPPKYFQRKPWMHTVYEKYKQKYFFTGKAKQWQTTQVQKWLEQQFQYKMKKYLGNGEMVRKMGRIDKINRKIEIGGSPRKNPIVCVFQRLNRKIEMIKKKEGLDAIFSCKP